MRLYVFHITHGNMQMSSSNTITEKTTVVILSNTVCWHNDETLCAKQTSKKHNSKSESSYWASNSNNRFEIKHRVWLYHLHCVKYPDFFEASSCLLRLCEPKSQTAVRPYQQRPVCSSVAACLNKVKSPNTWEGRHASSLTFHWWKEWWPRAADKCHIKAAAKELIKASGPPCIRLILWSGRRVKFRVLFFPRGQMDKMMPESFQDWSIGRRVFSGIHPGMVWVL